MVHRVLAIGLDGFDIGVAERFMQAGDMPVFSRLQARSACVPVLQDRAAEATGLRWEHFVSGLTPRSAKRWDSIEFDPITYATGQVGATFTPWWEHLDRRVVVFDVPYVDLSRAPTTRGIVGWGSHGAGTPFSARPAELAHEFEACIGPYPARDWIYAVPWPSSEQTRRMGEALGRAITARAKATRWVLERLPDWDLFVTVMSESHSALEGLWHGIDPEHPLHEHPSGSAAAAGVRSVYRALDSAIGELLEAAPDATVVVFSPGGMGPNHGDVPSMVLLPELLYRSAFSKTRLSLPARWREASREVPILASEDGWYQASDRWLRPPDAWGRAAYTLRSTARRLPEPAKVLLRRARSALGRHPGEARNPSPRALDWQPAQRYRDHWPRMAAFALPSFADGRVRINLKGREGRGLVELGEYDAACSKLEALLRECRDPRTSEPSVEAIERVMDRGPLDVLGSEADLVVVWRGTAAALEHPRLGLVGPVPLRRTGGHTNPRGFVCVAARDLQVGAGPASVSSFDLPPTLAKLLGAEPPAHLDGVPVPLEWRVDDRRAP